MDQPIVTVLAANVHNLSEALKIAKDFAYKNTCAVRIRKETSINENDTGWIGWYNVEAVLE